MLVFEDAPKEAGALTKECGDSAEEFGGQLVAAAVRIMGLETSGSIKLSKYVFGNGNIAFT